MTVQVTGLLCKLNIWFQKYYYVLNYNLKFTKTMHWNGTLIGNACRVIQTHALVAPRHWPKQQRHDKCDKADLIAEERCGGWCCCAGERILEMRSSRSSLNERARRASLLAPRRDPRCPEPASPQASLSAKRYHWWVPEHRKLPRVYSACHLAMGEINIFVVYYGSL